MTFQVMLYRDGKILFQYKNMNGRRTRASVGVQNASWGLSLAYKSPFVENGMAVMIKKTSEPMEGADKDEDGVRDDIEVYLEEAYAQAPKTRKVMRQMAEAGNIFLQADNEANSLRAAKETGKAIECLHYLHPNDSREKVVEMLSQLYNTYERTMAYIKRQKHLGGHIFTGSPPNKWKESCKFNSDPTGD